MGYPPLEDLLPKSGFSIYKLVRMASYRAIELADGKKALIESPSSDKTPTIALEEIQAGKIALKEVAVEFEPKATEAKKTNEKNEEEPEMAAG